MVPRSSILLAALVALSIGAPVSPVAAQEAIQLEIIGAVRMATPQEIQRMNTEATRRPTLPAAQPVSLQGRHAGIGN